METFVFFPSCLPLRCVFARRQHNKYEHVRAWMNEWLEEKIEIFFVNQTYVLFEDFIWFHMIYLSMNEWMNCFISSTVFSPIFMSIVQRSICYLYQIFTLHRHPSTFSRVHYKLSVLVEQEWIIDVEPEFNLGKVHVRTSFSCSNHLIAREMSTSSS